MKRRIGDQLKRIVAGGTRQKAVDRGMCPLFNSARAAIYQKTLDLVIAPAATIARLSGHNRQVVRWHMKALVEARLVDEFMVGGKAHYAPKGVMVHPEVAETYAVILKASTSSAFQYILSKPGASAENVPYEARRQLLSVKAIQSSRDGRNRRLYPSERAKLLGSIVDKGYTAHWAILQNLLKRQGVSFVVNPLRAGGSEIEVDCPHGKVTFAVTGAQFESALSELSNINKIM